MARNFKTLDDMGDVTGKGCWSARTSNVPMADGAVTDDTRLARRSVDCRRAGRTKGAKVIVLAHFGRPKDSAIRA